jgi:hypothetical protein
MTGVSGVTVQTIDDGVAARMAACALIAMLDPAVTVLVPTNTSLVANALELPPDVPAVEPAPPPQPVRKEAATMATPNKDFLINTGCS